MKTKQDYQSSVYVWGSTAHAVIGCPDPKVKSTKKVQLIPKRLAECCAMKMNGGFPIRVVSGDGFSTVVTDKFEAYTWGDGLGRGGERRNAPSGVQRAKSGSCKMKKVQVDGVASIAHGMGLNYALNLKGEIYCWGDGKLVPNKSSKSMGDHRKPSAGNASRRTLANIAKIDVGCYPSNAATVSCGEKHACVLLQDGMILTTGKNDAGQLGTGPILNEKLKEMEGVFHIVQNVRRGSNMLSSVKFKEIACGNSHCAAISSDGSSLFTWGWGDAGRLGLGNEKMHDQPTCVESLSTLGPFSTVACGIAQTFVASDGGDVYGFGWNAHGQVSGAVKNGQAGESSDNCLLPVPCLKNKGAVQLSCSGFHSAAITLAGDLYMWGMNEDGQCGAGHELPVTSPWKVSFPDTGTAQFVVSVSCGRSFTVCIISNFMPLEAADLSIQLRKETLEAEIVNNRRNAAQVIIRFARRLLHRKQAPAIQKADVNPPPENTSEELPFDDSFASSSSSSLLDDVITMNAEIQPQSEDRQLFTSSQETVEHHHFSDAKKISEENHNSRVISAPVVIIDQNNVQSEETCMDKEMTEVEPNKTRADAVISRILHETPQVKRSPKQKGYAVTVRDDQIDKAATRLKLARERREQKAVAKKILPRVQRSIATKIQHERKEIIPEKALPDIAVTKSDTDLAHLEWNRKLLARRASRLKAKEQVEKEAALIREQNIRIEQERARFLQKQAQMILEEQTRNAKNARRLRLSREAAELKHLEEKLNNSLTLLKGDENKENKSNFLNLKQWTKALSGG